MPYNLVQQIPGATFALALFVFHCDKKFLSLSLLSVLRICETLVRLCRRKFAPNERTNEGGGSRHRRTRKNRRKMQNMPPTAPPLRDPPSHQDVRGRGGGCDGGGGGDLEVVYVFVGKAHAGIFSRGEERHSGLQSKRRR